MGCGGSKVARDGADGEEMAPLPAAPRSAREHASVAPSASASDGTDDWFPQKTVNAVSAAVDAWNSGGSGASTAQSLLSAVAAAVPGIAETLGVLGEHAPLVGVVFSVLKVAGARIAAASETRAAYDEFSNAVVTTTRLVMQVEEMQRASAQPFPKPVLSALGLFWAQLDAFVAILVDFRGRNYAQRLWSQGKHQAKLGVIKGSIQRAHEDLVRTGVLVNVVQTASVHALVNELSADVRSVMTALKGARAPEPTWAITAPATFVGRAAELARLDVLLVSAPARGKATAIALSGMGGTGKSTLAQFAAQQHNQRFRTGWVLNGSNEATLMAGLAVIARSLGLGEPKSDEIAAAVTTKLGEPACASWLLIVDNVDDPAFKAKLSGLLPAVGGCVVVTSRLADWDRDGWSMLSLVAMPAADGTRLLLGPDAPPSPSAPAEEAAIAEVVTLLAGLPLALANARAYVKRGRLSWAAYLAKLKAQTAQGLDKTILPSLQLSLQAALAAAPDVVAVLTPLLQLLQVLHPDAVPRRVLTETLAVLVPGADCDDALAVLADLSIITLTETDVSTHRLMQAAMRARAPCPPAVADALTTTLERIKDAEDTNDFALMRQFLVQLPEVVAWLDANMPDSLTLARALDTCGDILCYCFRDPRAVPLYERSLAIFERQYGPDHNEVANTLQDLGNAVGLTGDIARKRDYLERALAIGERLDGPDHVSTAATLTALGDVHRVLGEETQAKEKLERALKIFEARYGREHALVADVLLNVAIAYSEESDMPRKKEYLERALAIQERLHGPDHVSVASVLHSLGSTYGVMGDAATKKALMERALVIFERHYGPDHDEVGNAVSNLANAYGALGDAAKKKELLQRALAIKESYFGADHPEVAQALNNLGIAHSGPGEATKKKVFHERALAILTKHYGLDSIKLVDTLNGLADAYSKLGDDAKKNATYARSFGIQERFHGPDHVDALRILGNSYGDIGDPEKKKELLERLLAIKQRELDAAADAAASADRTALALEIARLCINLSYTHGELGDLAQQRVLFQRGRAALPASVAHAHPLAPSSKDGVRCDLCGKTGVASSLRCEACTYEECPECVKWSGSTTAT